MEQSKLGYAHGSVISISIVYKLNSLNNTEDLKIKNPGSEDKFTAQNGLFGAVKITTDTHRSNYKYSGYGI